MTANRIHSLRELPQDISPSRDLWAGIEQEIDGDSGRTVPGTEARAASRRVKPRLSQAWLSGLAMAATVAAVAIGVWLGQTRMSGSAPSFAHTAPGAQTTAAPVYATFVTDPRYVRDRAALLKSLQKKLDALPPESQQKVAASIATIQKAKSDLEEALGRDPGNALLQELLVNTYQDEMRLLTTVEEAGTPGGGI